MAGSSPRATAAARPARRCERSGPSRAGRHRPARRSQGARRSGTAIAAAARVRGHALRRSRRRTADDGGEELLAEVERDVRQAEPMTGLAGCDHGVGRAAGALGVGPAGSSQSRSVTPIASVRHGGARPRCPPRRSSPLQCVRGGRRIEHGGDRVGERVGSERLAGTAAASSSVRPTSDRSRPGASASTMTSSSTTNRTAAYSSPRAESPISSSEARIQASGRPCRTRAPSQFASFVVCEMKPST